MRDFDTNEFPSGYLITFRCYGTWVHGDARGSMDRNDNVYGTPKIASNTALEHADASQRKHEPMLLDLKQRAVVEAAIREVCDFRKYALHAVNVRTNHAHSVVTANQKPEAILNAFKSYATRALRRDGLSQSVKPWARHGSTVYLWKDRSVARAIEYVMLEQGDVPFKLDD